MGKLRMFCQVCGMRLRVSQDQAGKKGKCPGCGASLEIPATGGLNETITADDAAPAVREPEGLIVSEPQTSEDPAATGTPRAGGEDADWFYADASGKSLGPFSRHKMLAFIQNGSVHAGTLVWKQGMAQWTPASGVGLLPAGGLPSSAVPPAAVAPALDLSKATSDASSAFKTLVADPFDGLGTVFDRLGPGRAGLVGTTFMVVNIICAALAVRLLAGQASSLSKQLSNSFFPVTEEWLKSVMSSLTKGTLVTVITEFACLTIAIALSCKVSRRKGALGAGLFVAGTAILSAVPMWFAPSIFGVLNVEFNAVLGVIFVCWFIIILYAGFTRVAKLPHASAFLVLPVSLCVMVYFITVALRAIFSP